MVHDGTSHHRETKKQRTGKRTENKLKAEIGQLDLKRIAKLKSAGVGRN